MRDVLRRPGYVSGYGFTPGTVTRVCLFTIYYIYYIYTPINLNVLYKSQNRLKKSHSRQWLPGQTMVILKELVSPGFRDSTSMSSNLEMARMLRCSTESCSGVGSSASPPCW